MKVTLAPDVCGANAAGKLGKIVRRVQPLERLAPVIAMHKIVPIGNDISQRATLMAKGNTAVHASRRLRLKLVLWKVFVYFLPVVDALLDRTPFKIDSADFKKTCRITHFAPTRTSLLPAPSSPRGPADNRAA